MFLLAADQVMVLPQEQLEQRVPEVFCVLFMFVAVKKQQPVGFNVCFFLSPQLEIYISEGTHSTEEDSECFMNGHISRSFPELWGPTVFCLLAERFKF